MTANDNDGLTILFQNVLGILAQLKVSIHSDESLFKYVAPFNNQIEKFGAANNFDINSRQINTNLPFDFPACFVETIVDSVNDLSNSYQQINGRLIVYISLYEYDLYEDHLKAYNMAFKVNQALHLLKDGNDKYMLRRQNQVVDKNYSNLYTYQLVYQFQCTDNTQITEYAIFGTNGLSFIM
jgi:hypothetical protein